MRATSAAAPPLSPERRLERLTPWLVAAAVAVGYAPSLALGWWREDYTWVFGAVDPARLLFDLANPDTLSRYRPLLKTLTGLIGLLGLDARLPSRILCLALLVASACALAALVRRQTRDTGAALIAALAYLSSERVAVYSTFISQGSAQLYAIFACLTLLAFQRDLEVRSRHSLAALLAAFAGALGSFEIAVNLPLAMAALLIARRSRDVRGWLATGAITLLAGGFSIAHLTQDAVASSHQPSLAAVGRNLRFALDHEGGMLLAAAAALAFLALRPRRRAEALSFAALVAVGLVPGVLFPLPPDTYLFTLSYLGGAALVGLALSEAVALALRAHAPRALPWVAASLAIAAGARAHLAVASLIEREWEMRESRALPEALAKTACFGGKPAWIAPLGLDESDRRTAFTTPPGEPTVLSRICGAPVRFEVEAKRLATPRCRASSYFLTRDGALVGCDELTRDDAALDAAIACGVPLESPALLRPSGVWSGPRILCVNVPRGEGITESDPPVNLEGDQVWIKKRASLTFAVPEDAARFTARLDPMPDRRAPDATRGGAAPATADVYLDDRLVLSAQLDPRTAGIPVDLALDDTVTVSVVYQPRTSDEPGVTVFQPRMRP